MSNGIRAAATAIFAVVTVVLLAFSSAIAVSLAATSLIMGGTGHPLSVPADTSSYIASYVNGASSTYIAPSGLCKGGGKPGCTPLAIYTPEQFRFDTGLTDLTFDDSVALGQANLDDCIRGNLCTVTPAPWVLTADQRLTDKSYVVYGYSQSAAVATIEKRQLITNPEPGTRVSFILTANPNRPHGGVLAAFPGLYIPIVGVTFNGSTPTNSTMTTVDVARQYDIVADFPTNPLNLLSDVNGLLGNFYYHANYFEGGPPLRQGQYGDTGQWAAGRHRMRHAVMWVSDSRHDIGPPQAVDCGLSSRFTH